MAEMHYYYIFKGDKTMENNEMMELEVMDTEDVEVVETENTGMNPGLLLAIGTGLGLAIAGAVNLGKKLWAKHKEKKALRQPDGEVVVTDEDIEDVTK